MGIHVHLQVRRDAIEPAAWNEVYDDTLRLLRSHPSGILGLDRRKLLGRDVVMYTREIERKIHGETEWCAVGDRLSMRFGESFHFPRDDSAASGAGRRRTKRRDAGEDLVLCEPDERGGGDVFGNKTQGEPYHVPILAAALVVEDRFPSAALVWGDIDEDDVNAAKAWAEKALEREVALPVLFDAPALLLRLSTRWGGVKLIGAFARRFCGELSRGLSHVLRALPRSVGEAYLRKALSRSKSERDADGAPDAERVARGFLLGGGSVARLCAIAAEPPVQEALPAPELASVLAYTGMLFDPAVQARVDRCTALSLPQRSDVSLVGYYLGAVFLQGKAWGGLQIDPGEIERALAEAYPGRAAELMACVREETRKLEELAAKMCEAMESAARLVDGLGPFQDIGELVAVRSPGELCAGSRRRLAGFAHALREARSRARQEPPVTGEDPDKAHSFFVAMANEQRRMTEDAWAWILREEEPEMLRLLADLFCCDPQSDEAGTLKRALLENRVLCEEVARLRKDSAAMAEAEALAGEARRREAVRRKQV